MNELTRILNACRDDQSAPADELLPLVYEELRKLAAAKLAREPAGHTLQATGLVHEAYLRLVDQEGLPKAWEGRAHFFAAAAIAMRRILVESARRKRRIKHGGDFQRIELDAIDVELSDWHDDLIALDEAMSKLAEVDQVAADLVHLRYFSGLTNHQAAELLGISARTAERRWAYARAWLHQQIRGTGE
ncbi:MAG: sigma-70 family RNA polymerase sigma factor [Pirellulaceae bacterium]|nr:sigma-70 family RNA polymerase sigma factor [Pirellulaceae bacterium]